MDENIYDNENIVSKPNNKKIKIILIVVSIILIILEVLFLCKSHFSIFNSDNNNLPVLVEFTSLKCAPCKKMQPVIEKVKAEYTGRLTVEVYDVSKEKSLIDRFNLYGLPTEIFFDTNGKEVYRHLGAMSKEDITKKLKELKLIK